jgi:hypothetical protein
MRIIVLRGLGEFTVEGQGAEQAGEASLLVVELEEEIQAKAIGGDLVFLAVLQRSHEEQETTNEDV